jgi:hypothetical protein
VNGAQGCLSDIALSPDPPWRSRQAIIFRLAALFCSRCKGQYALVFGFPDHLCRGCCFHVALPATFGEAYRPVDFGLIFDRRRTFADQPGMNLAGTWEQCLTWQFLSNHLTLEEVGKKIAVS